MKLSLPPVTPKSLIIYSAAILLVVLMIYFTIKKIVRRKPITVSSAALQGMSPANLTLTSFEYQALANQLQNELYRWGFFVGPRTDQLVELFSKLKTKDDFLMLVYAFGTRKNERYVLGFWEGDLFFWFSQRLDEDQMDAVRQQFARVGLSI